jgi:hypothetical protein
MTPFPAIGSTVVLAKFFTPKARRHAETFSHARLELYPGTQDKLW